MRQRDYDPKVEKQLVQGWTHVRDHQVDEWREIMRHAEIYYNEGSNLAASACARQVIEAHNKLCHKEN